MDIADYLRARLTRILSIGGCLLGLLAIHFAIFHDHWLARAWFPYDFPAGYYATVAYWVTSLQSGEWPQWIPYQSMGYPLLMNPQMGFFYPPFWVFVILRIPFTLHAAVIVQILHVLFGSIGFLLLANRLFDSLLAAECGAAAFLLFGGFYSNAEHADIIRGFAWVPWLLWASLLVESRLQIRNLVLPVIVACFITGAYTGQVIAGLSLLGIFLVVQAAQLFLGTRTPAVIRNLLIQFGFVALGVLIASAFLLTGAVLAGDLTRASGVSSLPFHWLTGLTLFDLFFPSNLIHPGQDYSMYGMQLPVVLLLFLPLIEKRLLNRLVPFLAVAVAAAAMSFVAFSTFSNGLRHLFPVFGLSRFPSIDYREFIYLAILLLSTGGLASVLRNDSKQWRKTAGMLLIIVLFGVVCLTCLRHDIAPVSFNLFLDLAKGEILAMLGTALLFLLCWWLGRPKIAGIVLLAVMPVVMAPVLKSEASFWADPGLLKNVYDGQGFPIEVHGELRTRAIFRRHETARGPRITADNHQMLSWWGYLDGVYLTNDSGGVIPTTRRNAELDPALLQFMREPSRLLQIPCDSNQNACHSPNPAVDLAQRMPAGASVSYSRNFLAYGVDVPVRSLAVENEMAIRGWHIQVDGKETPMKKVDGCLRGWIVPAGKHRVVLEYRTPLLVPGMLLSASGLAAWIAILWFFRRSSRSESLSDDCVILVSSDRTGG